MADSKGTKLTVDKIETLKCSKCNFSSTTLVRLKRHVKIHSDNKRFKCRECDFQTSESGNLKRHLKKTSWQLGFSKMADGQVFQINLFKQMFQLNL